MIGLLAGGGNLPLIFAKNAKKSGEQVITVAIKGEAKSSLNRWSDQIYWYNIGDLGKAIKAFKKHGVRRISIVGKVRKIRLFSILKPDVKLFRIFMRLANKKDATLIGAVIKEIEKEGIKVLPMTIYLKDLLTKKGVLTKRKPTSKERSDIRFGFPLAKKLADADTGQAVIIKDKILIAAEGAEGTDEMIKQSAKTSGNRAVCIKVARTKQDMRIDIPGIGPGTISRLKKAKISCLALEAGKMFIAEKEKVIKEAEKHGICVIVI